MYNLNFFDWFKIECFNGLKNSMKNKREFRRGYSIHHARSNFLTIDHVIVLVLLVLHSRIVSAVGILGVENLKNSACILGIAVDLYVVCLYSCRSLNFSRGFVSS